MNNNANGGNGGNANKPQGKELNIEISKELAAGTYSNLAIITHSSSEFIMDFARMLPGMPKVQVASRVIMTPEHAKNLYNALRDNIQKYEARFGEIKLSSSLPKCVIPMGFGPNTSES